MNLFKNLSYKVKYPLVTSITGGAIGALATDEDSGKKLENAFIGAGLGIIPGAGLAVNKYKRRIEAFSKYRPILNKMRESGVNLTRKSTTEKVSPSSYNYNYSISKTPGNNSFILDKLSNTSIYLGKGDILKKNLGSYKPGVFSTFTGEDINYKSSLLTHEYGHHINMQKAVGRPLQNSIGGRRLWAKFTKNEVKGGTFGVLKTWGPEARADELAA